MHIVPVIQRSPEWARWRARGVTASEAAIVLGRSPYKSPWRLWAERVGRLRPEDPSQHPLVRRGQALEDAARRACEQRRDTLLLPLCGESVEHPVLRASFDGIDDAGEPVELKVPSPTTYAAVAARGPAAEAYRLYWPQVQHQLYVAGAARGVLVFYGDGAPDLEFVIERDERFLAERLVPACLEFWAQLEARREPAPDPERDLYVPTGAALERWTVLAGEYRARATEIAELQRAVQRLEAAQGTVEQALLGLLGARVSGEAAGLRLTRYFQAGSLDYKAALAKLLPELAPEGLEIFRRAGSDRLRVTVQDEARASVPGEARSADTVRRQAARAGFFF